MNTNLTSRVKMAHRTHESLNLGFNKLTSLNNANQGLKPDK
jgi:hypothetical protein